jgi:hypothetical protein
MHPAVLINEPETIIDIPIHKINPLPVLIAQLAHRSGVWGVVIQPQQMIVLVDFYKNELFYQANVL